MTNKNEIIEIDLLRLFRALWYRAWLVILVTLISGVMALGITQHFITPQYESSVLMYVNSSNVTLGGTKLSISQSDLTAAKSLIDTYAVILNTRTTLNDVIEEAELTCSYEDLVKMLSAEAVNGTEVFQITVTNPDPNESTLIANTIAQVLPEKIASIVEGSSARIVDMAVTPSRQASPSATKNTIIGMLLGFVAVCGIIVVQEILDDKIYSSDYLIETYEIPMLAMIPDLVNTRKSGSDYYQGKSQNGKQPAKTDNSQ